MVKMLLFFQHWSTSCPRVHFDNYIYTYIYIYTQIGCFADTCSKRVNFTFRAENQALISERKVLLQSTDFYEESILGVKLEVAVARRDFSSTLC